MKYLWVTALHVVNSLTTLCWCTCPGCGPVGTVALKLMVAPLVPIGWGMRGEKDGLVMTTLAWAGWGGCEKAVASALGVEAGPDTICAGWPAEAAAAIAAAWWEIWCTMACMNSGGRPGKWTGVSPGYRERVILKNRSLSISTLKWSEPQCLKKINFIKEETVIIATIYSITEEHSPGCPGPAAFGCPGTWEPAADSPDQHNKSRQPSASQRGWWGDRVVLHLSNRTTKNFSQALLQMRYINKIYLLLQLM